MRPGWRQKCSSGHARHSFPIRHGIEAMKMDGKSRAAGAEWNEEIPDGREHPNKSLQASRRSKALHRPFPSA
jgi:hypothetical protein